MNAIVNYLPFSVAEKGERILQRKEINIKGTERMRRSMHLKERLLRSPEF